MENENIQTLQARINALSKKLELYYQILLSKIEELKQNPASVRAGETATLSSNTSSLNQTVSITNTNQQQPKS